MTKTICVITGSRADYGILYPVMKAIQGDSRLRLRIVVTGMHLMKEFGYTVKQIENDGFCVYERININYKEDSGEAMAFSTGRAVSQFSKSFSRLKPDMLVLLGDRGEMLAAAIAANYMNIPVVHIHGGEVSGHVDGAVRHAITKLSHIHLAATRGARARLLKLGEEPFRVFVVGAPALDRIRGSHTTKPKDLVRKYGIDSAKPLGILVQHPVHTQISEANKQIRNTLEVLAKLQLQTVIIYPNADAGGRSMIRELARFRKYGFFRHFRSISHQDYLGLLAIADVLIGNSSSGIIEAPSFGLPVVNIGMRQSGRERALNVIEVSHDEKRITGAVKKALYDKKFISRVRKSKNPYGDGHAAKRIARILSTVQHNKKLLDKRITY